MGTWCGVLWCDMSEQFAKVFLRKIVFFTNSFSPSKVSHYTVLLEMSMCCTLNTYTTHLVFTDSGAKVSEKREDSQHPSSNVSSKALSIHSVLDLDVMLMSSILIRYV